jgi:hypothetical protein
MAPAKAIDKCLPSLATSSPDSTDDALTSKQSVSGKMKMLDVFQKLFSLLASFVAIVSLLFGLLKCPNGASSLEGEDVLGRD